MEKASLELPTDIKEDVAVENELLNEKYIKSKQIRS